VASDFDSLVHHNPKLAFDCAAYADRAMRSRYSPQMQQRDAGVKKYQRVSKQLRSLHDKVYDALRRGDDPQFLEARAEQLFVQRNVISAQVDTLEGFLQERWDAFFVACYRRLQVIEGGRS
jgi:hypothetical protein